MDKQKEMHELQLCYCCMVTLKGPVYKEAVMEAIRWNQAPNPAWQKQAVFA